MPNPTTLLGFNWQEQHVESNIQNASGFITSESHAAFACPPTLASLISGAAGSGAAFDIPAVSIGLVENYSVAEGQQVVKIYEIGSVRSYLLAARADGQVSLNRVLLKDNSLLRHLYAAFRDKNGKFNAMIGNSAPGVQVVDVGGTVPGTVNPAGNGKDDFFFGLHNPLFKNPFGFMIFMKSQANDFYSAQFFENCLVSSHGFASSSSGVVVQEAAAFRYDRMLGMNIRAIQRGTAQAA